ncbi:MAG: hypothetical protein WCL32_08475 [Planctomycetota bacterium]
MRTILRIGYFLCFAIAFMPLAPLVVFFLIGGDDLYTAMFFMGLWFGLPAGVMFAHLSRDVRWVHWTLIVLGSLAGLFFVWLSTSFSAEAVRQNGFGAAFLEIAAMVSRFLAGWSGLWFVTGNLGIFAACDLFVGEEASK